MSIVENQLNFVKTKTGSNFAVELTESIVTKNGKIVWKHGPNWPFYALMLRIKLYKNPFFFTGHQNVNKPKSRAETVYGLIFLPFDKIIVSFCYFSCQDQTVL